MTPPSVGHSHRLPRSLLVMIGICIVGLLVAIVLSFLYAQNVDARLGRLEQYVQGRGEFRDQEQRRLEQQMRRSTCDLLDQLPEGGLLVKPRQKYHCGPGIPRPQPSSTPAPATPATPDAGGAYPVPARPPARPTKTPPPRTSPASPMTRPTATASASPSPSPVLPPICAVLGACR